MSNQQWKDTMADPDAGRRAIEQFKQARKDVA